MAIVGNPNDFGSYTFEIDGQEVQVQNMSIEYGTGSYAYPDPYAGGYDPGKSWSTGTATITTNWPPLEMETKTKQVPLNCLVCDKETEYTQALTVGLIDEGLVDQNVFALCPTCIEVVKEMRNHFIVGEIAEIMEG